MKRYLGYLLIINLLITCCLFFYRNALPSPSALNPLLKKEPLQTITSKQPFYVNTKEFRFYIAPLYEYTLHGLVVSKYNARKKFMARIDKDLNVSDLCVIWGDNAFRGDYQKISFWSGEFTCFARYVEDKTSYTETLDEAKKLARQFFFFNNEQFSNNHLLTDNPQLAKQLRNVHIGDQISFSGYLANYGTSPNQIYRYTSTVRTDTGNRASESVYVTSFVILRKNHYRQMFNLSLMSLFCISIIWLAYQLTPFTTKNNPEQDD
ncbi:hypothetical protein [Entomomonas asaccharolytica]|uniref:Transmembrane protein n=1 Tax=Entomomonas asaccharolytica TaxID=2785331 RepID=A0A974NF58_9GAMM|nr:hypothetical protein [Entomomonas asaccharolytica]QQP85543.1 hypothetical protein JHT90_14415 [Entomomonas asaccharolytica]